MQKIATKVFIYSSILFGIFGIMVVLTMPGPGTPDSENPFINQLFSRLLFSTVFIILPSFALSVASKYLNGQEK